MTNMLSFKYKNLQIKLEGPASEFCQGFISQEKYKAWLDFSNLYSSSMNSPWDDFCREKLLLDGYWEINDVAHFTAIHLNLCNLEIMLEDKLVFKGPYNSFRELIEEENVFELNSINESKEYGSLKFPKNKKYPEWLLERANNLDNQAQVLVTTQTDEYFAVEEQIQLDDEFDINKVGVIRLCTDEMGFGVDFGDFIIGIVYNKIPCYFEFPGGVGSCNKPNFQ
jgi:hypothetical protein